MPFVIKAKNRESNYEVPAHLAGHTLLEYLQQAQVPIRSSCLGKGICHQCRVKVEKGIAPITDTDRKAFSNENLEQGWRLSCSIRPKTNIEIFFPQSYQFSEDIQIYRQPTSPWWIACDLGTTGVELSAVDESGVWGEVKGLNRQVSMGPDIMTRLEYAQKHGVLPLQTTILAQLRKLTNVLLKAADEPSLFQKKMLMAGNSAVTSFAANKDITHLAVAPYQPSFFDSQKIDVYGTEGIEIETLPLLNSFVGGDLFAGLFLLWNQGKMNSTPWILIDVGTNSEIIFWDAERLFISSTPAGPAFEGSNISIGMRADPGSIIHPKYDRQKEQWNFDVIHNDAPLGICGSALIEWMAEALGAGIINDDGEVIKPNGLMLTKDLGLTQDDIREFQLAKSAIRTGLDLVASESPNKPKLLYLAGAFGSHLNLESTFKLGLIPSMEAYTLGNSSLQGTIEWGRAGEEKKTEFIQWINSVKHPIELALRADFQDAFIANMRLTHGEIATSR